MPQLAQNFAPPGSSLPHSVQCLTAGAIGVPQLMQNLAPAGLGVLQDAHAGPATAVGAAWGAGGACGGGAGRCCCCCAAPAIIPGSAKPAARNAPSVAPPPWAIPCPAPSAISPAAYCWKPPASCE